MDSSGNNSKKPCIAIAGASGFIGRWFIEKYHKQFRIIALSRSVINEDSRENVEWRTVDLYSLSSTERAISGADYALYLVHSMAPSTHLNQSSFEDTDLLLADNFSRSAEKCSLKQIIFIGGILPKDKNKFSRHLRSRYEVEKTLASGKTPVTSLRAGIIIGPGGSSFEIIEKLVKRLPVMACPKWTKSHSQPIDVEDALEICVKCIGNKSTYHRSIEIGGEERITYMDLLKRTSRILGKKRIIFSIPFFTLGFSKLWVGFFSDSNPLFASPLVESLKHDMTVEKSEESILDINYHSLDDSIKKALNENSPVLPKGEKNTILRKTVRSVQRLPNPGHKTAFWVAHEYPKWLPQTFKFLLKAEVNNNYVHFNLLGIRLLELQRIVDRSDERRQLFYIVGGKLAKRTDHGWLEFRSVLKNNHIISAIHEFIPSLPWFIYKNTQAVVHLFVMKQFGKYLSSLERNEISG